ncbi:MAG: hypothetical protein ACOYVF_02805 [Candidatus Zixiibacteriota bacterium]
MAAGTFNRQRMFIAGTFTMVLLLMMAPTQAFCEEMTMSPHKIILNAQGQFQDIQAVIRIPLQAGYSLTDYQVTLKFNDIPVSEAFDFRYCYIDDNFLASFDRTALQANPTVIAMANTVVIATVEGWFEGTAADGATYTQDFFCTDQVEIVKPDEK